MTVAASQEARDRAAQRRRSARADTPETPPIPAGQLTLPLAPATDREE